MKVVSLSLTTVILDPLQYLNVRIHWADLSFLKERFLNLIVTISAL